MPRSTFARLFLLCGCALAALVATADAGAQPSLDPAPTPATDVDGASLADEAAADDDAADDLASSDVYGWGGPEAATQLANDRTLVPADRGAIFVPYISDPAEEPEYAVFRGSRRVGTGAPGSRLVLDPGDYRLELGSGRSRDIVVHVKVLPGQTTLVPGTWAAMRSRSSTSGTSPTAAATSSSAWPTATSTASATAPTSSPANACRRGFWRRICTASCSLAQATAPAATTPPCTCPRAASCGTAS